ncbi:MAG: magnesium transporter CorA family protein [Actinomycetota bacterium]|nr:magnesium transporter CorA family protein [Actinomycetota bacterium]
MQRLFHSAPGANDLSERPADELDACLREGGWIWLDVVGPTEAEVVAVGARFGFDHLSIQDVLDVSHLPKLDEFDDFLFVVLHGVVTGEQRRLETSELDLFIGSDFLVTFHPMPLTSVDWVAEKAGISNHLVIRSPALTAAAIAEAGSRRYLPLLDALDDGIEELEDLSFVGDPSTLSLTHALRRDVIVLRRIVGPQSEVLHQLSQTPTALLNDEARRAFRDVYDNLFRVVRWLDASRALLSGVGETYRGVVAERTNEVMKILTVFSAILLPLALVTGIWGMNFFNLPWADEPWGFLAVIGFMGFVAVGLWLYFARLGFVGGPKLRDLPRSIGLGLVQIGTAPVRAVADALIGLDRTTSERSSDPDFPTGGDG